MTTASTVRPVFDDDDEEQQQGSSSSESIILKTKINLHQVFKDRMIVWYKNLPQKRKKLLLKKTILKQAMKEATSLRLDYKTLNPNWLRQLHEEEGLDFVELPPEEKFRRREFRKLRKQIIHPTNPDEVMKREDVEKLLQLTVGSISDDKIQQVMGKISKQNLRPSQWCPKKFRCDLVKNGQSHPQKKETVGKSRFDGLKYIDLLDEPPPKTYIDEYLKGNLLPRVMKTVVNLKKVEEENITVVYWDYNAPEIDRNFAPKIHESNNIFGRLS